MGAKRYYVLDDDEEADRPLIPRTDTKIMMLLLPRLARAEAGELNGQGGYRLTKADVRRLKARMGSCKRWVRP